MLRFFFTLFVGSCLAISFWQCGSKRDAPKAGDKLLAKVYNKNLYLSELTDIVPEGATKEDSALMVSAYTQRWVREQLLMYEAERNIPKDLNIDALVRDYRASLVRFNYEEQIIAERLDSTVTEVEQQEFYDINKDQFQLESTIVKCLLIKIPSKAPLKDLNKLWSSHSPADETKLAAYARQWAATALLDPKKWYKVEDVAALLPKGTLTPDNAGSRREGTLSDSDFRYYYRILDAIRGKETAPLEYVREQAVKVILHRRKQALLEKWKDDLYQQELRHENVKIIQ
ncbi:MAG: hypothetical protein IPL65_07925 [Lewinellaceae bacterium]|nr:hypothetical protein [Lewinellaceae bacterium]